MNYYTFKKFMALIDSECKQDENTHRVAVADSMRIIKEAEAIAWTNQALGALLEHNPTFYYSVIPFTPTVTSSVLTIPFFIRRLDRLKFSDVWYNVQYHTNTDAKFWWDGKRKITAREDVFTKDVEVVLQGIISPEEVIDEDSIIDFPPENIRLLLLQVLLYWAGRDNTRREIWFYQYNEALKNYKNSYSIVSTANEVNPRVGFGS